MNTPDCTSPTAAAQKPASVLVAEDSPVNRAMALKILEKLGYIAEGVPDGVQALAALQRTEFEIILMDCSMPEMNGYEATWQIREREKRAAGAGLSRHVYIIAMTANSEADNREKCRQAGMDDFINKPVQLPELDAALHRALAGRNAGPGLDDVIDPVVIAGLRQLRIAGRPDPLTELVDLFVREGPEHLGLIAQNARSTAVDALARALSAATALKGSAADLGARNVAALADEIVQAIKTGYLSECLPLVEKARQEFERACDALRTLKCPN